MWLQSIHSHPIPWYFEVSANPVVAQLLPKNQLLDYSLWGGHNYQLRYWRQADNHVLATGYIPKVLRCSLGVGEQPTNKPTYQPTNHGFLAKLGPVARTGTRPASATSDSIGSGRTMNCSRSRTLILDCGGQGGCGSWSIGQR